MAFAENGMDVSAVRTLVVAHVFDYAEYGNVHLFRHLYGLFNYHSHKILRCGDDDDTVHRQGLKNGKRHIAGSRRHIDKHIVNVRPDNIRPELCDSACNDRTAPYDRLSLVLKNQVDRHYLHTRVGGNGDDILICAHRVFPDAEGLGNRRACNVGVENGAVIAAALHLTRQKACHKRFADAALAGNNGDNLFYAGLLVKLLEKALRLAGGAIFSAGGAVMCTFAHFYIPFKYMLFMAVPCCTVLPQLFYLR